LNVARALERSTQLTWPFLQVDGTVQGVEGVEGGDGDGGEGVEGVEGVEGGEGGEGVEGVESVEGGDDVAVAPVAATPGLPFACLCYACDWWC
jgi:hypothetical protein